MRSASELRLLLREVLSTENDSELRLAPLLSSEGTRVETGIDPAAPEAAAAAAVCPVKPPNAFAPVREILEPVVTTDSLLLIKGERMTRPDISEPSLGRERCG